MALATTVVVGPRTRLGALLVERAVARGDVVIAVARHERDEALLAGTGATVVRAERVGEVVGEVVGVRVLVCALGPVQSDDQDVDPADVDRDVAVVEAALAGGRGSVVLISSVLALAPAADRRHYGGWKCLIEHRVREVAERRTATLSVFYPGRLVAAADIVKPWHRLHTRYLKLASLVEVTSNTVARSKVIGLDARLWLLVRGASVAASAISGSGGMAVVRSSKSATPPGRKQELAG